MSRVFTLTLKEALNKSIPLMVRQAHHERNQQFTVRPELVEGLNQRFLKEYQAMPVTEELMKEHQLILKYVDLMERYSAYSLKHPDALALLENAAGFIEFINSLPIIFIIQKRKIFCSATLKFRAY